MYNIQLAMRQCASQAEYSLLAHVLSNKQAEPCRWAPQLNAQLSGGLFAVTTNDMSIVFSDGPPLKINCAPITRYAKPISIQVTNPSRDRKALEPELTRFKDCLLVSYEGQMTAASDKLNKPVAAEELIPLVRMKGWRSCRTFYGSYYSL